MIPIKNILRRKGQSFMTMLITAICAFSFVMVLGVFGTFQQGMELTADRLGADIIVLPGRTSQNAQQAIFTGEPQNVYMNESVMDELASIEGIAQMSPQFFTQTLDADCCSVGEELRLVGYDQQSDFILKPWMMQEEMDVLAPDELICGGTVPSLIAETGQNIIILGELFHVTGRLYETGSGMDRTLFVDIDTARDLASRSDVLKEYFEGKDTSHLISSVMVKAVEGYDLEAIVTAINKSDLDVKASATDALIRSTRSQVLSTSQIVWVMWFVILILSMLALWGRFHALVRDRRREIGLLRAMGTTSGKVFLLTLAETWLLAAAGGVTGSLLAVFLTKPAISAVQEMLNLSSGAWSFGSALVWGLCGIGLSLVLGLVSAFFPCRKSASLEPMTAINRGGVD